ncbi:YihY/virulence factor BrkB family protein [Natrialbaceae archaeon AArc-T1-2]|uniref:YihY/virulence factor BrkB family protein n=1 Tax=Natrialbaceae archaeon AArc-T1-2 TaxID=3053904 RepID=UPI00255AAE81|nr:YihY/virulence factor BrkB family protein [Natrialbaceae archaeon AArc-T1-2]WIV65640.1 YihY/virulence factor BrkB family protein [Natrialbaceae archaeon AArc-T1-2]
MTDDRDSPRTVRRVIRLARAEQLTFVAAGVAFYAFVSLIPLALLGVAVATLVGGEVLAELATEAVRDVLTPSAQELLAEAITEETGRGGATVVGFVGLVWSGTRVLRGLDRAFSEVYGSVESKSLLGEFLDGAIVLVAVTFGLLALGTIEAAIGAATTDVLAVFGPVLLVVTLLVAFLPMYVVFPDANVSLREALPGAALAALGWTLLSRTFSVYTALAGTYALYGALGGVFLVLTWLYVGSMVLVLGAILNAVLAGRDLDRQLQSPGARQVRHEAMTDDATEGDDEPGDRRASARTSDRADDPDVLREEIERLRDELEDLEEDVDRRTVRKESLEGELKRYVRRRIRQSHARGWGPYLVLGYGTAMTIAAFYFLSGGWAILAMFVVWTSTIGVYLLMVLFGAGLSVLGVPGRLRDRIGEWRS